MIAIIVTAWSLFITAWATCWRLRAHRPRDEEGGPHIDIQTDVDLASHVAEGEESYAGTVVARFFYWPRRPRSPPLAPILLQYFGPRESRQPDTNHLVRSAGTQFSTTPTYYPRNLSDIDLNEIDDIAANGANGKIVHQLEAGRSTPEPNGHLAADDTNEGITHIESAGHAGQHLSSVLQDIERQVPTQHSKPKETGLAILAARPSEGFLLARPGSGEHLVQADEPADLARGNGCIQSGQHVVSMVPLPKLATL